MAVNMSLRFFFLLFLCGKLTQASKGTFWQITDIHLDADYSETGDVSIKCHNNKNSTSGNIGHFGNFSCDSPWSLVQSAIEAMKHIEGGPDFILWTGDNVAHLKENQLKWDIVYSNLENITDLLMANFPHSTIIPVIGNHDAYPANNFPSDNVKSIYQGYLSKGKFNLLIPPEATSTFLQGGYYEIPLTSKLNILVLNTNFYLTYNTNHSSEEDPTGQLAWLRHRLKLAQEKNISIIITAHVPPGYFERVAAVPFMDKNFNNMLVDLLVNYSSIILTQIYGHTHTDSFRFFLSQSGKPKSHAFIAPSISPWGIPLSGMNGINPSVRLYKYSEENRMVMDYDQYFMNLTKANNETKMVPNKETIDSLKDEATSDITSPNSTSEEDESIAKQEAISRYSMHVKWEHSYRATEYYGVKNLNLNSLEKIYTDLVQNRTVFDNYYRMNTAGVPSDSCDEICFQAQKCVIRYLKASAFDECFNKTNRSTKDSSHVVSSLDNDKTTEDHSVSPTDGGHSNHHRHHVSATVTYVILGFAIGLLISLIVVATYFVRRYQFRSNYRYKRHFSSVQS